jgi:ABC-type nitrate/sulfonate/bicarbonate transport system substrate-binding protein
MRGGGFVTRRQQQSNKEPGTGNQGLSANGGLPGWFARWLAAALTLAVVLATACGGGDDGDGGAEPSADNPQTVRVQLDWTPNTNHIGVYVAEAKGWYKEAGIELEILPYGDTAPDTIVANGQADIGFSFPPSVIFSRAAGQDVVAVASVLQRNPTKLAVLESSGIMRPKDLDGKTYAGFGLPYEEPQIKTVVVNDGGKGDFDVATLNTFAYEALYNKSADFSEIFATWEGIEADLRGVKLRTFSYVDYGMPDFPGVVLITKNSAVKDGSTKIAKFLEVTRRGYEYAVSNPDEASNLFIQALPGEFPEPELVQRSTRELASYFKDGSTAWGVGDAGDWKAYVHWFVEQDIVVDQNDKVIEHEDKIPGGPLFSNALLPGG